MTRGCTDCGKAIPDRNVSGRCHPCNGRAAAKSYDRGLSWLPDEWRADYRHWVQKLHIPAPEAKRIILEHIALRGAA